MTDSKQDLELGENNLVTTCINSYKLEVKTTPTIYIGYDPREHTAVQVLQYSIMKYSSIPIQVKTLNLLNLRRSGLYRRAPHLDSTCWGKEKHMKDCFDERPLSTEFSFSRFLIPMLNQYEGWALFMDCDMFFRSDPAELFRIVQKEKIRTRLFERKALWCVKHQDQPTEKTKMYGCPQTTYSKKNWSSFMLWDCGHPIHHNLTVDDVNTKPGSWLHSFSWLQNDELIGDLSEEWNFLDNHSSSEIIPKNMHFTTGGPWFPNWIPKRPIDQKYSDEWNSLKQEMTKKNFF